jgi:hypothetical protein
MLLRELVQATSLPHLMRAGIKITFGCVVGFMSDELHISYEGARDAAALRDPAYSEVLRQFYQPYLPLETPLFVQVQLMLAGFALTTMAWSMLTSAMSLVL